MRKLQKNTNARILSAGAIAIGVALGTASVAMASNPAETWLNATTGNWTTAANWSPTSVPGSGGTADDVYINNGGAADITTNTATAGYAATGSIYLNDGGENSHLSYPTGSSLTLGSSGYLAVSGAINVANGYNASINIYGTLMAPSASITLGNGIGYVAGNLAVAGTGTMNVYSGFFGDTETPGVPPYSGTNITVGNQGNGVLNISGGAIGTGQYGSVVLGSAAPAAGFAGDGAGTATQTGGTLTIGRDLTVGQAATGVYSFSGGTLNASTLLVGDNAPGTFTMTGGTLAAPNTVEVGAGSGSGQLSLDGGTSFSTSFMQIGNSSGTGSGMLSIVGTQTKQIQVNAGPGGYPLHVYSNGTLNFQVGQSGVTQIMASVPSAYDGESRSTIALGGTLLMTLAPGVVPGHNQVFDLLSTNGPAIDDNGAAQSAYSAFTPMALAAADNGLWTFGLTNNNLTLYAQYIGPVPEPTTLALLAAAGAGLLLLTRRRRRA